MKWTGKYEDEDGNEVSFTLPGKYEVCPSCGGTGTELYGSMKGYAYSADELAEDPDFAHDMMNGHYDVPCAGCKGKRVVMEPDCSYLNAEQAAQLERHQKEEQERADYERDKQQQYWDESGTPLRERY